MTKRPAITWAMILVALAWSAPAMAAPMCVGERISIPFPSATDVERHSVDVASARFAGLWQEGRIDGVAYRIFSNRIGMIADDLIRPTWRIEVFCDADDGACRQEIIGAPDVGAEQIADRLALCLSGEEMEVPQINTLEPVSSPITVVAPETSEEPDPSENESGDTAPPPIEIAISSCGASIPTDENQQVLQIQSILLEIGFDPGPVDGLIGPMTITALVESLGAEAVDLSYRAALAALRAVHCPS